jgi:Bacterial tandem repeat domain 1
VLDSSVNSTAEPGSFAEWYMTFIVNGQSARWSHEEVADDTVYQVGRSFVVPLSPNQTIIIEASGYEQDDTSANDTLPTAQLTLNPAQDFQQGGTLTISSGQSAEGSYSIQVSVEPHIQGQALSVQRQFAGVYAPGKDGHALWAANWKGFLAKWESLSRQGLRLTRLSTYRQDTGAVSFGSTTERMFVGVFRAGNDGHALYVAEWAPFVDKWKELTANGLRLVDIAVYQDGAKRMYAGVYRAGNDGHALWVAEWPSFEAKWKELSQKGMRLVAVDTYLTGDKKRVFAGVYRAGNDGYAMIAGLDWSAFKAKVAETKAQGLRLVDFTSYPVGGGRQAYIGAWRAGTGAQGLIQDDWKDFTTDWQNRANMRLVAIDTHQGGSEE